MADKPGLVWGADGHPEGADPAGNTISLASLTPGTPGQIIGTDQDGNVAWVDPPESGGGWEALVALTTPQDGPVVGYLPIELQGYTYAGTDYVDPQVPL